MLKKCNIDIIVVLISLLMGLFLGYLIGNKMEKEEIVKTITTENIEYVYLLQIAKFDNPSGANSYKNVLDNKNLNSIIVYDNVYYYIYGGISYSEEMLENEKNKFSIMGYNPLVKKELLIEKANDFIDDNIKYDFYCECINNLYKSLKNEDYIISDKYNLEPINIELFTQITILKTMKNEELRKKSSITSL